MEKGENNYKKKVKIRNNKKELLVGLEELPSLNKEKYPTVILVHGFGVTKSEVGMFDEFSEILNNNGFIVYRFDFSGRGESEGDYSKTSLSKMRDDLRVILDFVKQQSKVNVTKIGIWAQSFGTPTTVSLRPDIQAIVLTGAISRPQDTSTVLFGNGYNPNGISTRILSNGDKIEMEPQFWSDLETHNLLEDIKNIKCPILFLHGAEDEKIPLSQMEAYYENANEPKEKIILEGVNHSLKPRREESYEIILNWFVKYLLS